LIVEATQALAAILIDLALIAFTALAVTTFQASGAARVSALPFRWAADELPGRSGLALHGAATFLVDQALKILEQAARFADTISRTAVVP
jgi:hypothetical protein